MSAHIPAHCEWFVDDIAVFDGVDWVRGGGVPGPSLVGRDLTMSKFVQWDKIVLSTPPDADCLEDKTDTYVLDRNGQSMVAVGDKLLVISGGEYEKKIYRSDILVLGSPSPSPIERPLWFEKGSLGGDLGSSERIAWAPMRVRRAHIAHSKPIFCELYNAPSLSLPDNSHTPPPSADRGGCRHCVSRVQRRHRSFLQQGRAEQVRHVQRAVWQQFRRC